MEGAIHESVRARTHDDACPKRYGRLRGVRAPDRAKPREERQQAFEFPNAFVVALAGYWSTFCCFFFFLSFRFFLFQPAPCSAACALLRMRGCTRTSRRNPDTFEKPYNNPTFLTRGTTRLDKKSPFRARPCPINIKEETLFLARIKVFKDAEITALTFAT